LHSQVCGYNQLGAMQGLEPDSDGRSGASTNLVALTWLDVPHAMVHGSPRQACWPAWAGVVVHDAQLA
jgi:hypothetical protein